MPAAACSGSAIRVRLRIDSQRFALGTAQFGLPYGVANSSGQVSAPAAAAILDCARLSGIDTIDTAMAYGASEARLGQIGVDGWRIVSKLPPVPDDCRNIADWVRLAVAESLTRLKVERLYALMLHAPLQLLDSRGAEIYGALSSVRSEGFATKIGISIYDPSELSAIWPRFPFDIVQAPFNVFDRRLAVSGWLRSLQLASVEVHTRSAFLQGLLLMTPADRPAYFSRWNTLWVRWHTWLAEQNITPLEACLAFVSSAPGIDRIVLGVDAVAQLEQSLNASSDRIVVPSELASEDLELIDPSRWRLS